LINTLITEVNSQKLAKILNYQFENQDLLQEALTHRSKNSKNNNERLEFLGDSILGFVIAAELFVLFPSATEGELSRCRARLVKGETLAELARKLNIGEYLILGPGEMKSGGYRRDSTLADALEAIIGAIYIDSDLQSATRFVLHIYEKLLKTISNDDSKKDPKTMLQEFLQSRQLPLPVYTIISTEGNLHEQIFTVECAVDALGNKLLGKGSSRRKAEQESAKNALKQLAK